MNRLQLTNFVVATSSGVNSAETLSETSLRKLGRPNPNLSG